MTRKRKLLFIINKADFFISHRLAIAKSAIQQGYDVHVATGQKDKSGVIASLGIKEHHIALSRSGMNPINEFMAMLAIYNLLKKVNPDIIHNVTIKPVLYGSLMAKFFRKMHVVNAVSGMGYLFTVNSFRNKIIRKIVMALYRISLSPAKVVTIFQNPDDLEFFLKKRLLSKNQSRLIRGSGVDLMTYCPHENDITADNVRVIFPARMLVDKGLREFINAAKLLKEKNVRATFILVGDVDEGNPSSVTRADLEIASQQGYVEWVGHQQEMSKVYQQADIVCLPSYREGLPKALLEAAACSKVIVTTDVPGCREVVTDGVNGILVPAKDSLALADALYLLIINKELREEMGLCGRAIAESEFSIESVVDKTLNIYTEFCIAGKS